VAVDDVVGRCYVDVANVGDVLIDAGAETSELSVAEQGGQVEQEAHEGFAAHGEQSPGSEHFGTEMSIAANLLLGEADAGFVEHAEDDFSNSV